MNYIESKTQVETDNKLLHDKQVYNFFFPEKILNKLPFVGSYKDNYY